MKRNPLRAPLLGGALVLVLGGAALAVEPQCTLAVTARECHDAGGKAVEPVVPTAGTRAFCTGGSAKVRNCPILVEPDNAPPPVPHALPGERVIPH